MTDRRRFAGRSIVVTGGGSGIGEAAAHAFAGEGGRVRIGELDPAKGRAVVEAITAQGGTALFVQTDATDESAVKALIEQACSAHGPVRHAFNNIGMQRGDGLEGLSLDDWRWTIDICLTSAFL